MLSLKDLLAVLDRWDTWKRMRETPDRLDAMESRVADLDLPTAAFAPLASA